MRTSDEEGQDYAPAPFSSANIVQDHQVMGKTVCRADFAEGEGAKGPVKGRENSARGSPLFRLSAGQVNLGRSRPGPQVTRAARFFHGDRQKS